jgi:hypothetical protein
MVTALIGVVGVLAGAIVGSFLTHALQRRNAAHARLHEARLEAYRNFAAAIMEFRKELMDRWFIENASKSCTDSHDVYAKRSVVWATYFQVLLVAGDRDVIRRADEARDVTSSLKNVTTRAELNSQGEACRAAIGRFVELARHEVGIIVKTRVTDVVTTTDPVHL